MKSASETNKNDHILSSRLSHPNGTPFHRTIAAARNAILVIFLVNGIIFASWVLHIPHVKEKLALGESTLGLALLSMSLGALVAMPLAGWLVARHGSRTITTFGTIGALCALPLPVMAPSLGVLAVTLVFLGAAVGTMDVAMNAHAVEVEKAYGKPLMSSFHGLFSLGGFIGALIGGILLGLGISPVFHLMTIVLLFGMSAFFALRSFLATQKEIHPGYHQKQASFIRPTRPLIGLGILAFFVLFGEGAMMDWTTVYLADTLEARTELVAAGFGAFSIAMAVGRLSGDRLIARFTAVGVMRVSALVAASGLSISLILGHPLAAVAGFGCAGLGLSNMIPILFGAAGRTPGINPGRAIAAVTTTGYFGLLVSPPVIGFAAELVTLRGAFGLVVLCTLLVAVFARIVVRNDEIREICQPS